MLRCQYNICPAINLIALMLPDRVGYMMMMTSWLSYVTLIARGIELYNVRLIARLVDLCTNVLHNLFRTRVLVWLDICIMWHIDDLLGLTFITVLANLHTDFRTSKHWWFGLTWRLHCMTYSWSRWIYTHIVGFGQSSYILSVCWYWLLSQTWHVYFWHADINDSWTLIIQMGILCEIVIPWFML